MLVFAGTGLLIGLVAVVLVGGFFLRQFEVGITIEEFRVLSEEFVGVSTLVKLVDALGAGVLLHVVAAVHGNNYIFSPSGF